MIGFTYKNDVMNLRDLEYLIAIDEERHFNKAAERCFVSQPTLSGQLKKLEEELGVQLVERNKRQVKMTEVGNAVVKQARRILVETKSLKEIAQRFHDPMSGELHVGLIPTVAPYLLPKIMPSLKKKCADLQLWLHEHQTAVLLKKLRNTELDLLILALPVDTDEFSDIDLFHEPFWLAAPDNSAFANKKKLKLNQLEGHEILLLEEGHCLRGQALDVCFSAGAKEYDGFQATSLETLRYMVAEGIGMTLMPELAVPTNARRNDNIKYIPFEKPKPLRRIGLLYRKNSYREYTYQVLADIIKKQMKLKLT